MTPHLYKDELDFIEKNKRLIDNYPNSRDELGAEIMKKSFPPNPNFLPLRICILIHYAEFGPTGFMIRDFEDGGIFNRNFILDGTEDLKALGFFKCNFRLTLKLNKVTGIHQVSESNLRSNLYYSLVKFKDVPVDVAKDISVGCSIEQKLFDEGTVVRGV